MNNRLTGDKMIQKNFSNKMYTSATKKVIDDRRFFIKEAVEKIDFDTIIRLSEIQYIESLVDEELFKTFEIFFYNSLQGVKPKYVKDGDYDFINKATVEFNDYNDAAKFLTCCKLFIKYSSDYDMTINNEKYIFTFNKDRIDEEFV